MDIKRGSAIKYYRASLNVYKQGTNEIIDALKQAI
jgi:hypothetical protein